MSNRINKLNSNNNANADKVGEIAKSIRNTQLKNRSNADPSKTQGNNKSNTSRNKQLQNNAPPFLPKKLNLTDNDIKNLYYNKTMNMSKMCKYEEYKNKTRELLKILKYLTMRSGNYQHKILNKWEKETRNRVNYNVKNNIKNIKNIKNIDKLKSIKQNGPSAWSEIKWIKKQNELVQKTFYALKRISYIIEQLRLNKNEYSKLRNFLNFTLKNKNTHTIEEIQTGSRGRNPMGCVVNTEVINDLLKRYKNSTLTINNFINILYKHKKNNISDLHMFTNTLVGLTKNERYYKPNDKMKKKIGLVNKQILKSSSGKGKLTINIEGEQINEFFDLIYRDMVHDDTLTKIEDFKSVMKIFVKPNSNININTKINQFINRERNLSRTKANEISRKILEETILKNNKKTVSSRIFSRIQEPHYKMTRTLIRYLSGSTSKYKKFYILTDIDPKGILTNYVKKLKHGQNPRGKFLVTPASLLDPGGLYWNRNGVHPIKYFERALTREGGTEASLIALDSTMLDVTINYKDEGKYWGWGRTRIKILFNPRRGYEIELNGKNISTSTKAKANTKEKKIGKFLGDFLLILNTLILQDTHTRPVAFATGDANAAVIYKFMCDILGKEKARLFFMGYDSKYLSLKTLDMNDIIIKHTTDMHKKRVKFVNNSIRNLNNNYNKASSSNGNSNVNQERRQVLN
jgi:hypothetical protein